MGIGTGAFLPTFFALEKVGDFVIKNILTKNQAGVGSGQFKAGYLNGLAPAVFFELEYHQIVKVCLLDIILI
ncbi:hypothetical protein [Fluviicola sp.]|uniref:hypothetical protein n=1 Tax=Fluviicola sp. TaxID=1917219 RepID=UPI0031D44017